MHTYRIATNLTINTHENSEFHEKLKNIGWEINNNILSRINNSSILENKLTNEESANLPTIEMKKLRSIYEEYNSIIKGSVYFIDITFNTMFIFELDTSVSKKWKFTYKR